MGAPRRRSFERGRRPIEGRPTASGRGAGPPGWPRPLRAPSAREIRAVWCATSNGGASDSLSASVRSLGDIGTGVKTAAGVAAPALASIRCLAVMDRAVEAAVTSPVGPSGRFLCLGTMEHRPAGAPPPGALPQPGPPAPTQPLFPEHQNASCRASGRPTGVSSGRGRPWASVARASWMASTGLLRGRRQGFTPFVAPPRTRARRKAPPPRRLRGRRSASADGAQRRGAVPLSEPLPAEYPPPTVGSMRP
jgi:hypothetical protein